MKNQSLSWVFSMAKFAVHLFYYTTILIAVILTFNIVAGLLNWQPPALTFGENPSNVVSIPVEWGQKGSTTLTHTDQPLISLDPGKRKGILRVPIHSQLGLCAAFFRVTGLAGFVWFFGLLRQIFRHTRPNSPFHPENARRISQMGLLIIAFLLFTEIHDTLSQMLAKPYIEAISPDFYANMSYSIELNGSWVFGLVILALAQVYRRGVEIQQENELTV